MAKTIKVQSVSYVFVCDVIYSVDNTIKIEHYDDMASDTKSVRAIKKRMNEIALSDIASNYDSDNYKVIGIENIATNKRVSIKSYTFNASNEDIVAALINSDIEFSVEESVK